MLTKWYSAQTAISPGLLFELSVNLVSFDSVRPDEILYPVSIHFCQLFDGFSAANHYSEGRAHRLINFHDSTLGH